MLQFIESLKTVHPAYLVAVAVVAVLFIIVLPMLVKNFAKSLKSTSDEQ